MKDAQRMVLIINADDFGLDDKTNNGIVQSFKKGLCSSATLMPNMPGFKEACQLAHENKLLKHIGVHLVLRDGLPLTEKIKHLPRFCNRQGRLCFSPGSFFIHLKNSEKRALAQEIRAQIQRCRKYGIPLTHLDAHHNLHTIWQVCSILILLARQEGIPYIRIKGNSDLHLIPFRFKIYTRIFNYRLKIRGLARTKYFGSINHFLALKESLRVDTSAVSKPRPSGRGKEKPLSINPEQTSGFSPRCVEWVDSFETSIHPRINAQQMLVNMIFDKEIDLETEVRQVDLYKNAVSFSGAKYL